MKSNTILLLMYYFVGQVKMVTKCLCLNIMTWLRPWKEQYLFQSNMLFNVSNMRNIDESICIPQKNQHEIGGIPECNCCYQCLDQLLLIVDMAWEQQISQDNNHKYPSTYRKPRGLIDILVWKQRTNLVHNLSTWKFVDGNCEPVSSLFTAWICLFFVIFSCMGIMSWILTKLGQPEVDTSKTRNYVNKWLVFLVYYMLPIYG